MNVLFLPKSIHLCVSPLLSGGIQFATAQLPLLELMDCGMTVCDPDSQNSPCDESGDNELPNALNNKLHLMYQKLIIKHSRLKKLSLWGCSGLDVRSFVLNLDYVANFFLIPYAVLIWESKCRPYV